MKEKFIQKGQPKKCTSKKSTSSDPSCFNITEHNKQKFISTFKINRKKKKQRITHFNPQYMALVSFEIL